MPFKFPIELYNQIVRSFDSDPDVVRTTEDLDQIELIDINERMPFHSPLQLIEHVAQHYPDNIAVRFLNTATAQEPSICWTYKQYQQNIVAAANLFHSLGLQTDQSVALLLPNIPETLFSHWGAMAVGITAPINLYLEADVIGTISEHANSHVLVTCELDDHLYLQKAFAIQKASSSIKHIVVITEKISEQAQQYAREQSVNLIHWQSAIEQQNNQQYNFYRAPDNELAEQVAAYFHTGGTTGIPKLAQHTHRAQIVNEGQMMLTGGTDAQIPDFTRSIILCGLPLFHVNAVYVSALNAVLGAGELILAGASGFRDPTLIANLWPLIEHYKVTFFAAVPTVYAALLEQDSTKYDLSSLISVSCGAAPMPMSLLDEFHKRTKTNIKEGYGMTETTSFASTHLFNGVRKVGSVGTRAPYQQLRIAQIDDNGKITKECATNEVGNLLVKGPNIIPSYKQESANKDAWPEPGWLNTGDVGRLDEDGYLWLTGRAKDLIIRGGHNIDPVITEDALNQHPDVELAAAVGKPDAYAGELPIAYVQLLANAKTSAQELIDFAKQHIAERAAAPVDVIIVDQIPKTAVGKIFKPDLRKDIIARTYSELADNIAPLATPWQATTVDDKTHGLVVQLSSESDSDTHEINTLLSDAFDKFIYKWRLA